MYSHVIIIELIAVKDAPSPPLIAAIPIDLFLKSIAVHRVSQLVRLLFSYCFPVKSANSSAQTAAPCIADPWLAISIAQCTFLAVQLHVNQWFSPPPSSSPYFQYLWNSTENNPANMTDSKYFTTTKKGEIFELKSELNNDKKEKKKEAVKKVILLFFSPTATLIAIG